MNGELTRGRFTCWQKKRSWLVDSVIEAKLKADVKGGRRWTFRISRGRRTCRRVTNLDGEGASGMWPLSLEALKYRVLIEGATNANRPFVYNLYRLTRNRWPPVPVVVDGGTHPHSVWNYAPPHAAASMHQELHQMHGQWIQRTVNEGAGSVRERQPPRFFDVKRLLSRAAGP